MYLIHISLITLTLTCTLVACQDEDDPVVLTEYGYIRGNHEYDEKTDRYFDTFWGVPFAAPPLGDLRFRKPEKAKPWGDDIKDTKIFGYSCLQPAGSFVPRESTDEDCLFLNIWVPGGVQNAQPRQYAVLFFQHGGGNSLGASDIPVPVGGLRYLPLLGNIIFITFNYRLDSLGFLSTGDDVLPGNIGMWDTVVALQWVRDNIANFGGDPDRITVAGHSTGSSNIHLFMVSPQTRGMFQRVVTHSGTAVSPLALMMRPKDRAIDLAKKMDCPHNDSKALVDCLRTKNGTELVDQEIKFDPVIDGEFLPQHPEHLIKNPDLKRYQYMNGIVNTEGYTQVQLVSLNLTSADEYLSAMEESFNARYLNPKPIWEATKYQYFWDPAVRNDLNRTKNASWGMWHDWTYAGPGEGSLLSHAQKGGVTFSFNFDYHTSWSPFPVPIHIEDCIYFFGWPIEDPELFNEKEGGISRMMIKYYTNFIKNGDPNIGEEVPVAWPQYSAERRDYLEFSGNMTESSAKTSRRRREVDFWIDVVSNLITNCSST